MIRCFSDSSESISKFSGCIKAKLQERAVIFTALEKLCILNKLNGFIQKVFAVYFMPIVVLGTGVQDMTGGLCPLRPHNFQQKIDSE